MGAELLGKKIGMTQVFDAKGNFVGVTVIETGPCTVLQKKTGATDSYEAYQIGFGERKAKHATKALAGHCKKASAAPARFIREFRNDDGSLSFNVGDKITVKEFQPGQFVDVIGTSKGKGFAGAMKRHHLHGGPMTHGAKGWHRRRGASGNRSTPGRVFLGTRMAGHMGDERVTMQNLRVIQVRQEDNVLLVEGAVPGANGSLVVIRHAKMKTTKPAAASA